jgi:hypothetical protein
MSISEVAGAIVALINSKPTSPTQAAIEAVLFAHWDPHEAILLERMEPRPGSSLLAAQLREAMVRHRAADAHQGSLSPSDTAYAAAGAEERRCKERLDELEEEIPSPPESAEDILLRAVLARYHADETPDGTMGGLDSPCVFEYSASYLVEAVLQWHGLDPTKVIALPEVSP